jgi:hypothetical protein
MRESVRCTPGEYTRRGNSNQVPSNSNHVPENFLRQTNKPSILFKTFLTFHILVPEKMWTLGYLNQNLMIYESSKVFFYFRINILAFIFGIFYLPFLSPRGKIVDPFFRENELSEASGMGNQIPYRLPSIFFFYCGFFRGALLRANSRYLPPLYNFYGKTLFKGKNKK